MGTVVPLAIAVALFVLGVFGILGIVVTSYVKVPPNTVAVFSGRKRWVVDPSTGERRLVGYRFVRGGASLRWPVVERVDFLSLELLSIPIRVDTIYTKEGVPVTVEAVANVKVASDDISISNAVERFLSKPISEIEKVTRETLEGQVRSILSNLTVEEANRDRQAFQEKVVEQASSELRQMGLMVDNIVIKAISDSQGYLDALGQRRTAEVKRDADIGKAEAERDAKIRSAQALREGEVAKAQAETQIAEAKKERDINVAQYDAEIAAERARAAQAGPKAQAIAQQEVVVHQVKVEEAKTKANIAVQEQEVLRKKKELEATVVEPARAQREAQVLKAEGEKQSRIIQAEGRAAEEQNVGQGEASHKLQVGEAEAQVMKLKAEGQKAELLAEAEGQRAKLLAEAEGERARLLAQAEGERELAAALSVYQEVGVRVTLSKEFIERLPQMIEAASKPLSGVDKITIFDSGNGHNGSAVTRLTDAAPATIAKFLEAFAATTGVDLRDLLTTRTEATLQPPSTPADGDKPKSK